MAEKKQPAKKSTAPSKAKATSSEPKKVQNSGNARAKKTKKTEPKKIGPHRFRPDYLKPAPERHAVGTEEYRKVVEDYNERFGTTWNSWRCQPQVFYTIHSELCRYYDNLAIEDDKRNS